MALDPQDPKQNPRSAMMWPTANPALPGNISVGTAQNAAAVVSFAADLARPVNIGTVWWSYTAAATGGRLTIADTTGTLLDIDLPAAGPGSITFNPPLASAATTGAVTVTLAAGTASTGKVGCTAWRML